MDVATTSVQIPLKPEFSQAFCLHLLEMQLICKYIAFLDVTMQ